jgi:hypothetical protein
MDLPEFTAWAVIYQAEAGDLANLPLARTLAASVDNPELQARAAALKYPRTGPRRRRISACQTTDETSKLPAVFRSALMSGLGLVRQPPLAV